MVYYGLLPYSRLTVLVTMLRTGRLPHITASWQLKLANFSGVIYTVAVIVVVTVLNLSVTCPALSGYGADGCHGAYIFAIVVILEITVNLALFHLYNKRNQVSYWTLKSSSLFRVTNSTTELESVVPTSSATTPARSSIRNSRPSRSWPMTTNAESPFSTGSNNEERKKLLHSNMEIKSPRDLNRYQFAANNLAQGEDGVYRQLLPTTSPLSPESPPGTKWCVDCNLLAPRRSHHCPICGICVLRKDHHCFLTGGCVGLANQRFFIVFLFWASLGSIFGTGLNAIYMHRFMRPWYPFGWCTYIGPVALIRWLAGYETGFNALLAIAFSVSVASTIGASSFFVAQTFYTLNGYTMHDYHVGRLRENLESDGDNSGERLALVFGRHWWLNFIFPLLWERNQMTPSIAKNIFMSQSKDL